MDGLTSSGLFFGGSLGGPVFRMALLEDVRGLDGEGREVLSGDVFWGAPVDGPASGRVGG